MLRHFVTVEQTNWHSLLPMAEFAINNAKHESTQFSPFYLNYGRHPNPPIKVLTDIKGTGKRPLQAAEAERFVNVMHEALAQAKHNLTAAQHRQKAYADVRRTEAAFVVGDQVLLSTVNLKIKTSGSKKLCPKFVGPFKIKQVVNPVAYKLDLPTTMRIHPVFHVSLLKPYSPDKNVQPPPPPLIADDGDLLYIVKRILDHRDVSRGRNKKLERQYLIAWEGYGPEHNSWEPESNVITATDSLEAYWQTVAAATDQLAKRKQRVTARRSTRATS
jgi:hypothetical protein